MEVETPNALISSLKIDVLIASRDRALDLVAQAQSAFPNPYKGVAHFSPVMVIPPPALTFSTTVG